MAQLAERLLPKPEICSSNPTIGKFGTFRIRLSIAQKRQNVEKMKKIFRKKYAIYLIVARLKAFLIGKKISQFKVFYFFLTWQISNRTRVLLAQGSFALR